MAIPPIDQLDTVIINSSRSLVSGLSHNLSVTESVSTLRKPYMMKEKHYDNSNGIIRTLENTSKIVSKKEIKNINLKWKNSTMISFSTWGKKVLHAFLSWHLLVKITLTEYIVEKFCISSKKDSR